VKRRRKHKQKTFNKRRERRVIKTKQEYKKAKRKERKKSDMNKMTEESIEVSLFSEEDEFCNWFLDAKAHAA
jgi:hypothetical protein